MNPLQSELHRLYLARPAAGAPGDLPPCLIDSSNRVRSMVLELAGPPDWQVLSKVWQGVQAELELPAPAIAVSGIDGLQLWFSLAEPITAPRARAFLEALRSRFIPDVAPGRLRLLPAADASALHPERHARLVPALQGQNGNWSAFLAPDLASVFADTPWLDIPPNEEGQAALLRGLKTMTQAVFAATCEQLGTAVPSLPSGVPSPSAATTAGEDPKRFLLRVMNDDTVALALRIEAAKALLVHSNDPP